MILEHLQEREDDMLEQLTELKQDVKNEVLEWITDHRSLLSNCKGWMRTIAGVQYATHRRKQHWTMTVTHIDKKGVSAADDWSVDVSLEFLSNLEVIWDLLLDEVDRKIDRIRTEREQ